ncbi:MAG TPA: hypothetical protein VGK33_01980 [Chloroflexota bacterium]
MLEGVEGMLDGVEGDVEVEPPIGLEPVVPKVVLDGVLPKLLVLL